MLNEENKEILNDELDEKEKYLNLKLFVLNAQNEALKEEVRKAEQKYEDNIKQINDLESQLEVIRSCKRISSSR